MNRKLLLFLLAFVFIPLTVLDASPVEVTKALSGSQAVSRGDVDISIRLIGGKGSVLREGRDINLTFRTSRDAYVVIYNIDSDGLVQLLYPENGKLLKTKGEEIYSLPDKGLSWEVRGETGIEYIHAVAVTNGDRINAEELRYLAGNKDLQGGEQLRVDIDPFLAFNRINELIIEDADDIAPATDFTYFYINREVDYPRYLCSSCHGEGKIEDPYAAECPEVVIEKMLYEEDPVYPFPPLFSIQHVEDSGDVDYASEYYEDNLSGDLGGYDSYDDDKVYLSIYYTDYDYPYSFYYPSYRTWYTYYYDPWGWDYYDPWYTGSYFMIGWNDYYYHHWPYYTWYDYRYDYYAWSVNYRYYDGFLDYHCYNDDYLRDRRSIYSGRDFKKRSIDYAAVTRTNDRTKTLRDSKVSRTKSVSPDARTPRGTVRDKSVYSGARDSFAPNIRNRTTVYDRDVKREVIHGDARKVRTGDPKTTRTTRRTYSPSSGTRTRRTSEDKKTPLNYNNNRSTIDRRSKSSSDRKSNSSGTSTSKDRRKSSSTSKSSTSTRKSSSTSKSRSSSTKKTEKPSRSSSTRKSSSARSSSASSNRSSSSRSSSRSSSSKSSSSRSSSGRRK